MVLLTKVLLTSRRVDLRVCTIAKPVTLQGRTVAEADPVAMTIKRPLKPDFNEGIDRKDLTTICQRFLSLIKQRLERTRWAMTTRQRLVLDVLPLLFHVNHPLLPGYVSRTTPASLRNYEPDKDDLREARRLSRSFNYRGTEKKTRDIVSLFLMGSTGSIAHSTGSDLDIWLCYRNGLSKKALTELQLKAERISVWAAGMGAEVHIFPMNAAAFRQGRHSAVADTEDCGTAQQFLLLDEFYRTGIWLAGAYPLWWLIPPEQEDNYDQMARLLVEKRFIRQRDYIDFGGCAKIPANEFVGAGMWQLYKSIDSPFKSLLKLKLIECYAREEAIKPPLCISFKRAIFDDELDADELDPYVMIYRHIENTLNQQAQQQQRSLSLVRRSFYLKIGEALSRYRVHHEDGSKQAGRISRDNQLRQTTSWRRQIMEKLVLEWAFDQTLLKHLDNREYWRIDDVVSERRLIVNELSASYRYLSAYARDKGLAAAISARDINLLGRKLYAAFQRKAGKIEAINPGIAPSLAEINLAFHHLSTQALPSSTGGWLLYRNLQSPSDADYSPALKRSNSLIELLVWAYINGLLAGGTDTSLVAGTSAASSFELQHIILNLRQQLLLPLPPVSQSTFHQRARILKVILFVNVGVDPMADMTRKGMHKISAQSDSLGYASSRTNLVLTVDAVLVNSWNEVMVQRYESGATLVQCLNNTLAAVAEADQYGKQLPALQVYCFCPNRAEAIAKRVDDLFREVFTRFFATTTSTAELEGIRYLLQIEQSYFILQFEGKRPQFSVMEDYDALCDHLVLPQRQFRKITVDSYTLKNDPLETICRHMKAGVVQIYIVQTPREQQIWIMDESGSLVTLALTKEHAQCQLGALSLFLCSILERRQMRDALDLAHTVLPEIKFYNLLSSDRSTAAKGSRYRTVSLAVHPQQGVGEYLEIQAVGQFDANGELCFSLFCEHQEFSPLDHGLRVMEALAHYIVHRFRNSVAQPCYLTDLSLPAGLVGDTTQVATSIYLCHKRQLELQLAEAIQAGIRSSKAAKPGWR